MLVLFSPFLTVTSIYFSRHSFAHLFLLIVFSSFILKKACKKLVVSLLLFFSYRILLYFILDCCSKSAIPHFFWFLNFGKFEYCCWWLNCTFNHSCTLLLCLHLPLYNSRVWFSSDMEKVSSYWYWIGITGRKPFRLFQNCLSRKGENKYLQQLIRCSKNRRLYLLIISIRVSFKWLLLVFDPIFL